MNSTTPDVWHSVKGENNHIKTLTATHYHRVHAMWKIKDDADVESYLSQDYKMLLEDIIQK